MKKALPLVLLALILATGAVAQTYENPSVVGQVPDRVVITLKENVKVELNKSGAVPKLGVAALDDLAERFEIKELEQLYAGMTGNLKTTAERDELERVWAVDFPAKAGLQTVKNAYAALSEVAEVRLVDICKQYAYLPNDTSLLSGSQWYLRNLELGGKDIRAVGAWGHALGDSNVLIAIVDSGVDWNHPDLGGTHPDRVNGAIATNWAEYEGATGVDDDLNGKIDDIRGWDFVHTSGGWPGEDTLTPDNDPSDWESHGTACAGVAAAITNNGVGIAGAAPGCKILPVRVGYLENGQTVGVVRMDWCSQGMIYATNMGADIINTSWGSTSFLNSAVTTAQVNGVLITNAAGNDGSNVPDYLGTRSGVLCVAATDSDDTRSTFSNYGDWVEICAPGTEIYTTHYNFSTGQSTYSTTQGTSFSSPIAAGAAALVWSANPGFTYSQVADALMDNADNIDALNPGFEGELGAGRINLLKALGGDSEHLLPAEFPTLLDAINESDPGDVIMAEGGVTFSDPVIVPDKDLQILGGYDSTYTTRDPSGNPTIIVGDLTHATLSFLGAVSSSTVIDGFRIEGGGGKILSGIPDQAKAGGGILISSGSPTLRNLQVTDNGVGSSSYHGCGGGVFIRYASPIMENVDIYANTAVHGAGLYAFEATFTMTDCDIYDNLPVTNNGSYTHAGGGVYLVDSTVEMTDCTISGHEDYPKGAGLYATSNTSASDLTMYGGNIHDNTALSNGAGLYMDSGQADLTGVTFEANAPGTGATVLNGGAFYFDAVTVNMDSVVSYNNNAHLGAGGMISAVPSGSVTNSLFHANTAVYNAGGLYLFNGTAFDVTGNTIYGNDCAVGGAGMAVIGCPAAISNNIVAFNTGGGSGNGIVISGATPTLTCNDVYSNDVADYFGVTDPTGTDGNISADPLFCDAPADDFSISAGSPCAPAHSGGCDLIGAFAVGSCSSPVDDEDLLTPTAFKVEQNFPNPFNPKTTIRFSLAEAGRTQVVVYDVAGHLVKTLIDEDLPAQVHEISWTGRNDAGHPVAAGVYFYLVVSGENRSVGRMALVK